jgi:hypothetical protein
MANTGLIELPRRMVLQMAGQCSLCNKDRRETFGLAGIVGRPARICDECIGFSLDFFDPRSDELEHQWLERLVEETAPKLRAFLSQPGAREEIEAYRRDHPASPPKPFVCPDYHCSFCDRSRSEGLKLVAGVGTGRTICEDCAGDAAGLLAASGSPLLASARQGRLGVAGNVLRLC